MGHWVESKELKESAHSRRGAEDKSKVAEELDGLKK